MRALVVRMLGRGVGVLTETSGRMAFDYDEAWLDDPAAPPLSLAMPPRAEPYDDDACRAFFGGLLPEGAVRDHLARRFGISPGNDFSLLERIGGDCAGAVSLHPPGGDDPEREGRYDWLDDEALAAIIADLPTRPLGVDLDGEVRLSLAGAQDKLPVFVGADGRIGLPHGGAPSSHIIKAPLFQRDSVLNEAVCLALASDLGMDAAKAEPRTAAGQEFLLVTRYDRRWEGDRLVRVHQEDFGQALGTPSSAKYESEGGPGAADCVGLLRRSSRRPAADILRFVDAFVLNVLVGNTDAHAKNFSILFDAEGARLAPLYDILCTHCYTGLTRRMAMRIGGQDKADWLDERHWDAFAAEAGLAAGALRRRRRALAKRVGPALDRVIARFDAVGWSRPITEKVSSEVVRRAAQLTA